LEVGPAFARKHEPGPPAREHFTDLEKRLRDLTTPLSPPEPGDWLAEHHEKGQTFRQYLSINSVRRSRVMNAIYVCLIGDFTEEQKRIFDLTREYLSLLSPWTSEERHALAWKASKHAG
jgi:hypothetical protein